jgi:hypothetical protein
MAALVLADVHGRCSYFPAVLRLEDVLTKHATPARGGGRDFELAGGAREGEGPAVKGQVVSGYHEQQTVSTEQCAMVSGRSAVVR